MKIQKNIKEYLSSGLPEKVVALAAVGVAVIGIGGSVFAYGPERTTHTIEKPADHITFNTITNNPNHGDERNFVQIKPVGSGPEAYTDSLKVENGKEYIVRVYVHNNAAANLNLVSKNTRVSAGIPQTPSTKQVINGFISSDNAKPSQVWDDVVLTSDKKFNISYIPGSAKYFNNVNPNQGFNLSDNIVTKTGALVGYESMNGDIPGCFKYSGIALFHVKAEVQGESNFAVNKQVRKSGTKQWQENIKATPGEKLDYRIVYANTGDNNQDKVVVKDRSNVPHYDSGTVKLFNSIHNGLGMKDELFTSAINIGDYGPKTNAAVMYSGTVPTTGLACGTNTLKNTATVITPNGERSDSVDVSVDVECKKPIEVCDTSTNTVVKIDESQYDEKKFSHDTQNCQRMIEVCDTNSGNRVTIKEQEFDSNRHSKNLDDCNAAPVTPSTLPTTGPAEIVLGLIAVGLLAAAGVYYYRSRSDLKKVLAGEELFGQKTTKSAKTSKETKKLPSLKK